MGAMRSRTGCLTCRQRKLKCDETKPVCGQCTKAGRDCQFGSGITFRHQHNASMNSSKTDGTALDGFYAYKNTFDDKTTWVAIPKNLTFFNTTDPYQDNLNLGDQDGNRAPEAQMLTSTPDEQWASGLGRGYQHVGTHGLEALSAAALRTPPEANLTDRQGASHRLENGVHFETPNRSYTKHSPSHNVPAADDTNRFINANAEARIDPELVSLAAHDSVAQLLEASVESSTSSGPGPKEAEGNDSEQKMASLLRDFSGSPLQPRSSQTLAEEG